jgi:miniconductance mechanosensitive channel
MKGEVFLKSVLEKIKETLMRAGVPDVVIEQVDVLLYLILILLVAFVVGRMLHAASTSIIVHLQKRKNYALLTKLVEFNVLKKVSFIVPPIIVIWLLPVTFVGRPKLSAVLENIAWIYFIVAIVRVLLAILSSVGSMAYTNKKYHDKPIKGFVQITQMVVYLISVIIIISILTNKSPFYLIGGLGAFAAVLMLIFKDTIMGFVAGILLLENDMVRLGDWIEMPGTSINGTVTDISLTIVKVQNFDNTIITIPPYTLISESFINWRGMKESGGRRIMRGYTIKIDNIKRCTPEFLSKIKSFSTQMSAFIDYMQCKSDDAPMITREERTYGTIETNLGLFRAYATYDLKNHPLLHKNMLTMVRTLEPTEYGLPLQIYCFTNDTEWSHYESIQSEIMENLAATLPLFELLPYQSSSSHDSMINGLVERGFPLDKINGIPIGSLQK